MLDILEEAALRSLFLAGVVQCALCLLRVRQAQLLLAAWTIVLAASIAMPMLPQFIPLDFPLGWATTRPTINGAAGLLQGPSLPPGDAVIEDAVIEFIAQTPTGSCLEAVYLAVGCGMLVRVVLGVGLSWRLLSRAVPVEPERTAGRRVRISRELAAPVTIARTILLPIDAADWSDEMRQAVLAHEQSHVARWDFAMLIVSQLNRALFWFSPLSWWLHRRLITLTELTSDDQAMALTRDRLGYAEILLKMGHRSGPVSRGPAMARPSTLPQRIDRILLDQTGPSQVSQPQQVMLMVGVAVLSLGVASLLPSVGPGSATILPLPQLDLQIDRTIRPARVVTDVAKPVKPEVAAEQTSRDQSGSPLPSSRELGMEPQAQLAAARLPRAAVLLPIRRRFRTSTKNTPGLPLSRAIGRPNQAAIGRGRRIDRESPEALSGGAAPLHGTSGFDVITRTSSLADDNARLSPPRPVTYQAASEVLHPELQVDADRMCIGTVTVGMGAGESWPGSSPQKITVVPGQIIAAQAQFFHKADGASWVRFKVFDRPPLDLPVRLVQGGMAWTGEYGIAYAMHAAGGNQFVGLASRIASDSARLEFACQTRGNA